MKKKNKIARKTLREKESINHILTLFRIIIINIVTCKYYDILYRHNIHFQRRLLCGGVLIKQKIV